MVEASSPVVLYVGLFAPNDPDMVLHYFEKMHAGHCGWVDVSTIDLDDPATRRWIDEQHKRLGFPEGTPPRAGYYLFLNGQARAHHSGLIDFKRDQLSVGIGIAAALVALLSLDNALFNSAMRVAQVQAAIRVIEFFEKQTRPRPRRATGHGHASAHTSPPRGSEAQAAPIDELAVAFETLGLTSSATQDETRTRYRTLAKKWHPDRYPGNSPECAEASVRMSQINVAYSVICAARRW